MNINARGSLLWQYETSLPFVGITRIRFNGYDLNRTTRPVPPLLFSLYMSACRLTSKGQRHGKSLFFYQTHLIETLPTLAGKVNLPVFRIVGDSIKNVRIGVTQRLRQ